MRGRIFSTKGFTLIELMIVIGIIATLVFATTFAYGNHLQSSRDTKRQLDLQEIRIALEEYRTKEQTYPEDYTILEREGYLSELPEDPLTGAEYTYEYDPAEDSFNLRAELENSSEGDYYIVTPKERMFGSN